MQSPNPMSESRERKSHPGYARTRHRAKQHDSAHAEALSQGPVRRVDHPLVCADPGEFIAAQSQLEDLLAHLRAEGSFAYDSEFIGELSYHPRLCLIQVATTKRIGLIDPMVDLDLRPFWELLADASVEKTLHASEQDIEPVNRLIGQPAKNIFDTQIAAGFVALAYPIGLSKLVNELIGVKLGKGLTFTHWDQRPLTPLQLAYAADDVRYLPAVRAELGNRLKELGHEAWSKQECDSLCDPSRYGFDPETYYLRIRGASSLSPQQTAVLRELTIWRDAAARSHDVPPRAYLKDEILVDLSRSPVKSVDRLDRVKGLPRPVEAAHGAAIVEATLRALSFPPDQRPPARNIEPTPSERFGAESLHALASVVCAGQSIDPALVTSRQEISELHRALSDQSALPDIHLLQGWRNEACGRRLIELFQGNGRLGLEWRENRLRAVE